MPALLSPEEIRLRRAANHLLVDGTTGSIAEVARRLVALQAQDHPASLWSLALRAGDSPAASDVAAAFADRSIVRSWPLRGTLHVCAADDLRPLLAISADRSMATAAGRRRQLGIDAGVIESGERIAREALARAPLRRNALLDAFADGGLDTSGQRAAHLLAHLALSGVICFGPRDGGQHTFALLDDWIPGKPPERESALRDIAVRYFASHGPASTDDLAWWAGITRTEAKQVTEELADDLLRVETDSGPMRLAEESPANDPAAVRSAARAVRLLPAFDEYLLGYTRREPQLDPEHAGLVAPGANGLFRPVVSVGGKIVGTWRAPARGGSADAIAFEWFGAGSGGTERRESEAGAFVRFRER